MGKIDRKIHRIYQIFSGRIRYLMIKQIFRKKLQAKNKTVKTNTLGRIEPRKIIELIKIIEIITRVDT